MKKPESSMKSRSLSVRGICLLSLLIPFSLQVATTIGCGGSGSSTPPVGALSVAVSPHSATVQVNGQQQFMASVTNTSNTAVSWTASGGTVSPAGLYTAPSSAGTFTVTATSQADPTKSDVATLTITAGTAPTPTPAPAVVSIVISPSIISVGTGGTQQFTAVVSGTANTAVTWTATAGTITSSGMYTAPAASGTPTVTATSVADSTKSASAPVLVGGAGSPMAQAAAQATPGQWFRFTAAENSSWNGGALLNLGSTYSGSDNGTTWSSKASWNPVTKEFYFTGGGHGCCGVDSPDSEMVLRYNDASNTWSSSYRDGAHTYESSTINTSAGTNNNLYHRVYNSNTIETYSIASQSWTANLGAGVPSASGPDCCLAMEYFPDRNSLVTVDNDNGAYEYSFASGHWSNCLFDTSASVGCGNGTHSICGASSTSTPWTRYDPVKHRMLLGGCTNVYALSNTLGLTQLAPSPFNISSATSASPVTLDPGSGKLVSWDTQGNTFSSDGTSWVNVGPSPFADPVNGGLACATVTTYNVIMCFYAGTNSKPVTGGTIWLLKLQ